MRELGGFARHVAITPVNSTAKASTSGRLGSTRERGATLVVSASRRRKAREPGLFEVRVLSPPPRSLGIHSLPPNTHCGETIEVDGEWYIVAKLVCQYKLHGGRYVRDHHRLDVERSERWVMNRYLEGLLEKSG